MTTFQYICWKRQLPNDDLDFPATPVIITGYLEAESFANPAQWETPGYTCEILPFILQGELPSLDRPYKDVLKFEVTENKTFAEFNSIPDHWFEDILSKKEVRFDIKLPTPLTDHEMTAIYNATHTDSHMTTILLGPATHPSGMMIIPDCGILFDKHPVPPMEYYDKGRTHDAAFLNHMNKSLRNIPSFLKWRKSDCHPVTGELLDWE